MVPSNPDFNYSKRFISFSFDKITTGTYSRVSVILKFNSVGATILYFLSYQLKHNF